MPSVVVPIGTPQFVGGQIVRRRRGVAPENASILGRRARRPFQQLRLDQALPRLGAKAAGHAVRRRAPRSGLEVALALRGLPHRQREARRKSRRRQPLADQPPQARAALLAQQPRTSLPHQGLIQRFGILQHARGMAQRKLGQPVGVASPLRPMQQRRGVVQRRGVQHQVGPQTLEALPGPVRLHGADQVLAGAAGQARCEQRLLQAQRHGIDGVVQWLQNGLGEGPGGNVAPREYTQVLRAAQQGSPGFVARRTGVLSQGVDPSPEGLDAGADLLKMRAGTRAGVANRIRGGAAGQQHGTGQQRTPGAAAAKPRVVGPGQRGVGQQHAAQQRRRESPGIGARRRSRGAWPQRRRAAREEYPAQGCDHGLHLGAR